MPAIQLESASHRKGACGCPYLSAVMLISGSSDSAKGSSATTASAARVDDSAPNP